MSFENEIKINELYIKIVQGRDTSHKLYDPLYNYAYDHQVLFIELESFGFKSIDEYKQSKKTNDHIEVAMDNFNSAKNVLSEAIFELK